MEKKKKKKDKHFFCSKLEEKHEAVITPETIGWLGSPTLPRKTKL